MISTPFLLTYDGYQKLQALARLAGQSDRLISRHEIEVAAKNFDANDPGTRFYSPVPVDQTIDLPFGWKVTLSVEEQPFGRGIHLSVSSPTVDRFAAPEVVEFLMGAAGFKNGLKALIEAGLFYFERYTSRGCAINVLEPLDCDLFELRGVN